MKSILIALAAAAICSAAQGQTFDPCEYQVEENGCWKLSQIYNCRWEPARCTNVNPNVPFDPCRYQVNPDGCSKLGFQGCRWSPGSCTSH